MDEDLDFAPMRVAETRTIVLTRRSDEAARFDRRGQGRVAEQGKERFQPKQTGVRSRTEPAARRPRRRAAQRVGHRPDRIVLWAVVLGAFLILIAATSSQAQAATVGRTTLAMGSVGVNVKKLQVELKRLGYLKGASDSFYGKQTRTAIRRYQRSRCLKVNGKADAKTLNALRALVPACSGVKPGAVTAAGPSTLTDQIVQFGSRSLGSGATGDDVTVLQQLLAIAQTGVYDTATVQAVTKFQVAAGLTADGVVGQVTAAAIGNKMSQFVATWYGPGLYGNKTACGQVLTTALQGTAHRTLACGTKVTFFYNGRFRTVRVVDRGPFSASATFDLTAATAQSLGLVATATLRAAY